MHGTLGKTNPVAHSLIVDRKILATLASRVESRLFPVHRIGSDPILHFILAGARFTPVDADRIYVVVFAQVDDDPLRMQRVVFVGERIGQVRIALPESFWIAIREARVATLGATVVGAAAVGEAVSKRIANGCGQFGAANKISTLIGFVRPSTFRIPVPIINGLWCMQAIADWSPACRQANLYTFRRVDLVNGLARLDIH